MDGLSLLWFSSTSEDLGWSLWRRQSQGSSTRPMIRWSDPPEKSSQGMSSWLLIMVSQLCNQSTIDLIETDLVFMTKVAEKSNMLGEIAGISEVFIYSIQELFFVYLFVLFLVWCHWFCFHLVHSTSAPLCKSCTTLGHSRVLLEVGSSVALWYCLKIFSLNIFMLRT